MIHCGRLSSPSLFFFLAEFLEMLPPMCCHEVLQGGHISIDSARIKTQCSPFPAAEAHNPGQQHLIQQVFGAGISMLLVVASMVTFLGAGISTLLVVGSMVTFLGAGPGINSTTVAFGKLLSAVAYIIHLSQSRAIAPAA